MYNFKATLTLSLLVISFNSKGSIGESWDKLETPHQTVLSLLATGAAAVLVNKIVENKSVKSIAEKASITSEEIKFIAALEAIVLTLAPMTRARDQNGNIKLGEEGFYYFAKRIPLAYVIGKIVNTKVFQDVVGAIPLGIGDELKFDTRKADEIRADSACKDKSNDVIVSENRRSADWLRMILQVLAVYVPANKYLENKK